MPLMHRGGKSLLLVLLISLMSSSSGNERTSTTAFGTSDTTTPSRINFSTSDSDDINSIEMANIESSSTSDDFVTTTTLEPDVEACPDGFKHMTSDWCFHTRYDDYNTMDFQDSQKYCEERNAILPAITSVEVTIALMRERSAKMGISPAMFYIGLGCNRMTRSWIWIDGPDYDPGQASFARQFTNVEICTMREDPFVFDQYGTWSEYQRLNQVALVVCAVRPSGYSDPIGAPCTTPWTPLAGGICYRLDLATDLRNVFDAEKMCKIYGGHLPSIRSREQSDVIQAWLSGKKIQSTKFWIGLYCRRGGIPASSAHDLSMRGIRAWFDGTTYNDEFTNFLDPNDDTSTCDLTVAEAFLFNGAIEGEWQRENYSQTLPTLMCSKPGPDPALTTSTPTTRKTTDSTDKFTTMSTTSTEPTTTTSDGKNRKLTRLELILIISLGIVIVTVLLIALIYFLCKRIRREHVQEMVNNMQKRFSRSNTNAIVRQDEWEIRRQFVGIDYSRQLGRGAFGSVYLGRVFSGNIPEMAVRTLIQLNTLKKENNFVAVKTLHETADREAANEFMEEINIMKKIGFHERLVNILGCVTETEPLLLIIEYCSNGDLLHLMRERRMYMLKLKDTAGESFAERHLIITHRQQLMFGIQIAYGMEYLAQRGFVHRDLAARNILVDQNETCKIGDFGLCRKIEGESEQYISRGGRLPWKWMAPEALERFYFSVESDVWSFGVVLFEIITLGGNPYPDWPAVELLHRLKSGERMAKPDICSDGYYEIMLACWKGVPMSRLSFEKIRRKIGQELEDSSSEDYYLKLDAAAKYYQESLEVDRNVVRFNSF